VLALRTLFDPRAAGGLRASTELRLGEHRFHARIAGGRLELVRASAEHPDAIIETDPATLAALLWHDRKLADADRAGAIRIDGDRAVVERFLELFPAPLPAAAADAPAQH
jgi:ubiquinone biosynthesis protein UbiJ